MAVDGDRKITDFLEKPADPPAMPGNPDVALASMGIYVFDSEYLYQLLEEDNANPDSSHDFGKDIIPHVVPRAARWPTLRHVLRHARRRGADARLLAGRGHD